MESQPQNPEFRINPENSHPRIHIVFNGSVTLPLKPFCIKPLQRRRITITLNGLHRFR